MLYSTYLGGSGFDTAYSLAIDPAGNAYLGGEASADFPLSAGAYDSTYAGISEDGFVAKIRPDSSRTDNLLYSTYLGGDGYGFDFVSGIGVDTNGKIYAVGYTDSTNFPTTSGAAQPNLDTDQDGFVVKLDPNLSGQDSLLYSSYLGGAEVDYFFDLAVDAAGYAYVVGGTWGSITMHDPDMGDWSYAYDAAGNLTRQTDATPGGQSTCLYYDTLNRLLGKQYLSGTSCPGSPSYNLSYGYDSGATYGVGRRTVMTDTAGTVKWNYDIQGRVTDETRHFGGPFESLDNSANLPSGDYVTRTSYDLAGRLVSLTYPDGEVVTTTYTLRSLPKTLISTLGSYVSNATYDAQARLDLMSLGSGVQNDYNYFAPTVQGGRLEFVKTISSATTLLNMSYNYDAVGNITSLTDNTSGQSATFTYDHLERLLTAAANSGGTLPGYSESYGYDFIGNITSRNNMTYNYPTSGIRPHAVTSVVSPTATFSYSYDGNGNMLTRTENGVTYNQQWTEENKLKKVTWVQGGKSYTSAFVYDGDGNRLLEIEDSSGGGPEITTVYIGGIYEQQFETTANNFVTWLDGGGEDWKTGGLEDEAIVQSPISQPSNLQSSNPPALQPLALTITELPPVNHSPFTIGNSPFTIQSSFKPAGLASPLPPGFTPPLCLPNRPQEQAGCPLDAWADGWVSYNYGEENIIGVAGSPNNVIGANNSTTISLGWTTSSAEVGWIIVDMGAGEEAICNGAGNDLTVYETGNGGEDYKVYVANQPDGPWIWVGTYNGGNGVSNGTKSFDLGYVQSARYVKIANIERYSTNFQRSLAGPDIDAVQAHFMCAPAPEMPVITSPANGALYGSNPAQSSYPVTLSGNAGSSVLVDLYQDGALLVSNIPASFCGQWSVNVALPPGTHSYTAVAKRGAYSSPASAPVSLTFDNQPPALSITTPAANTWLKGTVLFSGSASDTAPASLSYQIDGGPATALAFGAWSVNVDTTALATSDQPHTFTLSGSDQWGNNSSVSRSFYVDNTIPTVQLLEPNTPYQGTTSFPVTWSGSDTPPGPLTYTVQYQVNGGTPQSWYTGPNTSNTFNGSNNNTYTFQVQATDRAGNTSSWAVQSTTVNTATPSITNTQPITYAKTTTPTLSGQFLVNGGSSIVTPSLVLTLDGASLATSTATITPGGFSRGLTSALSQGSHTVTATIANAANLTGQKMWSFTVDSISPTVTIAASPGTGRNISVNWSSVESGSGIANYTVQYRVGSSITWTGWLTNVTYTSTTFAGTPSYTYTFQVTATDLAGNSAVTQTGAVKVESVTKYYSFGAQRVAMRRGTVVYFLHGDHLGSTSLTTDASGNPVSQARYLPYGQERWTDKVSPTDFTFTAQRVEAGFGLMDYNARYYSGVLGRFISPDSIVPDPTNPQHWNRYGYANNNPVRYTDPTGHWSPEGSNTTDETYLKLSHRYEEAAAAAGDSWRGTLNEYLFAKAVKYYNLAQGDYVNAQVLEDAIEFSYEPRLAMSGYYGRDEAVNTALGFASDDLAQGMASLGSYGAAAIGTGVSRDLFAFGNTTGPRPPRPGTDVFPDSSGVLGTQNLPLPNGASTFGDISEAPLTGHYHRLPSGTQLPDGLGVVADGVDVIPTSPHPSTHHTIYNTQDMHIDEFTDLFKNLPWEYAGKKK